MMNRSTILAALGALLLLPWALLGDPGQQPRGAGIPPSASKIDEDTSPPASSLSASAPKVTLADFGWLAGRWQGAWGPRIAQQVWTSPKAGVMLGTFQLAENDKTLVLELFTIAEDSGGIKFHLRHFTPSLVAWEKPGPTVLNLANADAKTIVFVNPTDGQPRHITIVRMDADTYVSRYEVVPEHGEIQTTEITYHRQKDAPPARKK